MVLTPCAREMQALLGADQVLLDSLRARRRDRGSRAPRGRGRPHARGLACEPPGRERYVHRPEHAAAGSVRGLRGQQAASPKARSRSRPTVERSSCRSSWPAGCGARSRRAGYGRGHRPTTPRTRWSSSGKCSLPRSRTPSHARRWHASPTSRPRCGGWRRLRRANHFAGRGPRSGHRRGGAGLGDGGRRDASLRARRDRHARRAVARRPGTRPHWAAVSRSRVRTSSPRCIERDRPPAWTTGRAQPVRSRPWRMCWVFAPAVATPIVVEGQLWGTMIAATSQSKPLPADTESRIVEFTELRRHSDCERRQPRRARGLGGARRELAHEQAALRRVATLVAQHPSPNDVFTAVTEAVAPLLGADLTAMHVFTGGGTATVIAGWSAEGPMLPLGTRLPLDGDSAVARIFQTGPPPASTATWRRKAKRPRWRGACGYVRLSVRRSSSMEGSGER